MWTSGDGKSQPSAAVSLDEWGDNRRALILHACTATVVCVGVLCLNLRAMFIFEPPVSGMP